MLIYDFVEWELQKFRDECNFTPQEMEYFNLRAKGKSNVQIALEMMIGTAQTEKEREAIRQCIEKLNQ